MDAENYIYHKEAITMDFYKRALELKDETVADRRYIHQNAETGLELPKTKAYVIRLNAERELRQRLEMAVGFFSCVQIWMDFRCRRKVVKHLPVQQEKQHILVDMIFMQQCF